MIVALTLALASQIAVPRGIPRELARQRADRVSNIRYRLQYTLRAHSDGAAGHEDLRFRLSSAGPLLLDFREGKATRLVVNGTRAPLDAQNGHLVLPAAALRTGLNDVSVEFTTPVAPANRAITRYEDRDDGSAYIYTLFVPMDASMAFPCFDQPDLKARFTLQLTVPSGWTAISNSPVQKSESAAPGDTRFVFGETRPISTYLFAFAAGPFQNLHPVIGLPNVYVRRSQAARATNEIPQVQEITARGIHFLSNYFAQPFPFPKYDMVLIPGFAYGGMEHAGATFIREESVLFRTVPTDTDRFNRNILLLHELTHQWFGDFTTMRWFDDLWLKEGFAEYMAFRAIASLEPQQHVWVRFYQEIKPAAYGIDVTKGTTPIYQDIPNLLDAKSAYGAIVYDKAPGLLRQLAFLLGEDAFRNGLRVYLHEHPYSNAEWMDLVHALERSSGRNLTEWADAWIRRRGMPIVDTSWSCNAAGQLTGLTLRQHNVLGEGGTWPLATQVVLGYPSAEPVRLRAELLGEAANVAGAAGNPCPAYVFGNDDDYAYGLFMLDPRTRAYAMTQIGSVPDLFRRTLLWGGLWDAVRFAKLNPRDYLSASLRNMPAEIDEQLVQSLARRSSVALHDYVDAQVRHELVPKFEALAIDHMLHSPSQGLRIIWFRTLDELSSTSLGLNQLANLLNGKTTIPDVRLLSLDRWRTIATLLAQSAPDAGKFYETEKMHDKSGDGVKYSYVAEAAKPTSATKKWYFNDYLNNRSRPEDWVEQSLGPFNEWNESELTLPYLEPALAALPQMKKERKIFFVLSWLNAFIGGQNSAEADAEVHQWLNTAQIDQDLRLKVLQVVDGLDRTVKIRQTFP